MSPVAPFEISRTFNAPRDLLFAVQTQPEHLAHWMSPEGFHSIHSAMDFRVGGSYHYGLEGPGGMKMWGKQVYRDIQPGSSITLLQSFSDRDGGLTRHPMAPTWPLHMLATTRFDDAGPEQTKLSISWLPFEADETAMATFDAARAGMAQGFGGSFEKLAAYLAALQAQQG